MMELSDNDKRVFRWSSVYYFSALNFVSFQGLLGTVFSGPNPEAVIRRMSERALSMREVGGLAMGCAMSGGVAVVLGAGTAMLVKVVLEHTGPGQAVARRCKAARAARPRWAHRGAWIMGSLCFFISIPPEIPSPFGVVVLAIAHAWNRFPPSPLLANLAVSHAAGWMGMGVVAGAFIGRATSMINL